MGGGGGGGDGGGSKGGSGEAEGKVAAVKVVALMEAEARVVDGGELAARVAGTQR